MSLSFETDAVDATGRTPNYMYLTISSSSCSSSRCRVVDDHVFPELRVFGRIDQLQPSDIVRPKRIQAFQLFHPFSLLTYIISV